MSVATGVRGEQTRTTGSTRSFLETLRRTPEFVAMVMFLVRDAASSNDPLETATENVHVMEQMGARRIGSLAIGIGVVGIVLNEMSSLDIVNNSTGVIDVSGIFDTAGSGLNLLVVGVIIAAAAVLLNLWSGF